MNANQLKLPASGLLLAASMAVWAQSDRPITVVVNGQPIAFDNEQPRAMNGRVLVPLRGIFERLGATVDWDPANQTVTASRRSRVIRLTVGERDAAVDSKDVELDVPATLINGSTMVPLRFVSEALGADVQWRGELAEVDITPPVADPYRAELPTPPVAAIRPPVTPTPPPPPTPPPAPTVIIVHDDDDRAPAPQYHPQPVNIDPDVVLPWRLDRDLSSHDCHPGDMFTASLSIDDEKRYPGLPHGCRLHGHVHGSNPQRGSVAGQLTLQFDFIEFPNGHRLSVSGRFVSLDSATVTRRRDGALVQQHGGPAERPVYTGPGGGRGHLVCSVSHRADHDGKGFEVLTGAPHQYPKRPKEVELHRGEHFGLALSMKLVLKP